MKQKKIIMILTLGLFGLLITSCATIMQGTTQDIGVSSSPIKATVKLDGVIKGETPLTLEIKRKKGGTIRIEKEGYEPAEIILTKKMSGWVFGNIIFGGIPGLIIDLVAGGTYQLKPESINVNLTKVDIGMNENSVQEIKLTWNELRNAKKIFVTTSDSGVSEIIALNITD